MKTLIELTKEEQAEAAVLWAVAKIGIKAEDVYGVHMNYRPENPEGKRIVVIVEMIEGR